MTFKSYGTVLGLIAAGFFLASAGGRAQSNARAEEFSAIFANISNVGFVGATPVRIRITRWTSDAEHEKFMAVLASKGTEALVRELQDAKSAGSIGTPTQLPYDLRYARQHGGKDGGRQIILMTDRPMDFWERLSAPVTRDYPITWIELNLDDQGNGQGTMSLAARLRLVGDILGIEDFANQPAKLNEIKKVK